MNLLSEVKEALLSYESANGKLAGKRILAAVSGGADSMVMLDVLFRLSGCFCYSLSVITVNHNIRPEAETSGDAEFVRKACIEYGIPCSVHEIRKGGVAEAARLRGKGLEEAARQLRYEAFEQESSAVGAACVCIAHNRNDRLETILQRFLQGAGVTSAAGMRNSRGLFFRPLFNVPRNDIELYAAGNGITFRTDLTNSDNSYFRNRIRNSLIPFLNEIEPGWDSAVIHGSEKNIAAADDIAETAENIKWAERNGGIELQEALFDSLSFTLRTAVLYNGLVQLKCARRVPYAMLSSFAAGKSKVTGAGIRLERINGKVLLSSYEMEDGECGRKGFFLLVTQPGRYLLGEEPVTVIRAGSGKGELFRAETEDGCVSGLFRLPVAIRNGEPSDSFRMADGNTKLLSKIFSDWHVPRQERDRIPVFEDDENRGVWGSLYGFPDWFVKIQEND